MFRVSRHLQVQLIDFKNKILEVERSKVVIHRLMISVAAILKIHLIDCLNFEELINKTQMLIKINIKGCMFFYFP
jgi:hypothetical protein